MVAAFHLILVALVAHAETVRFTPWSEILDKSPELLHHRSAVHSLKNDNGDCTATTISDQGHILTARHCVTKCLIRSRYFTAKVEQGVLNYFERDDSKTQPSECPATIDGQNVTIQIEITSPGLIFSFDEPGFKSIAGELYRDMAARGYTSQGDFAIFKIKGASPSPCMGLSSTPARPGETQRTLGYPSQTFRPDGHNSDGVGLFYSKGTVIPSITENRCVMSAGFDATKMTKIIATHDLDFQYISTLDAIHASSGTAAINDAGHVTGILTNIFDLEEFTKLESDKPMNRYCEGSTKALRTEVILKSLRAQGYDVGQLACSNSQITDLTTFALTIQ